MVHRLQKLRKQQQQLLPLLHSLETTTTTTTTTTATTKNNKNNRDTRKRQKKMSNKRMSLRTNPAAALLLIVIVMTSLILTQANISCNEDGSTKCCSGSGCCNVDNYGPGPLNLIQKRDGFDSKNVGEKGYIYHCVRFFTSFVWFKNISNKWVPYPWERGSRVHNVGDRFNQSIEIVSLKKTDEAAYKYVASNGSHEVNGTFNLYVYCQGSEYTLATEEQPVQYVKRGSAKSLHCAVKPPDCPKAIDRPTIIWLWKNESSGETIWLKNGTLPYTSVICRNGKLRGRNCTVTIESVEIAHYEGEFICRFIGESYTPRPNETVRFFPIEEPRNQMLPVLIGVPLSILVVFLILTAIIWHCYGHRLQFWCRRHPDRGEFLHDAVIVHGEDHEDMARDHLKPGLQDLGYDVTDEVATPGKLELLEKADAILNSYCVILAFSDQELRESSTRFLTDVTQLKASRSVVFVRLPLTTNVTANNDIINNAGRRNDVSNIFSSAPRLEIDGISDSGDYRGRNSNSQNLGESRAYEHVMEDESSKDRWNGIRDTTCKKTQDVWKDNRLKAFKVIEWPRNASTSASGFDDRDKVNKLRTVEKFWYKLRNHLPKPSPCESDLNKPNPKFSRGQTGKKQRQDFNSFSSEKRLLSTESADETSSTSKIRVSNSDLSVPRPRVIEVQGREKSYQVDVHPQPNVALSSSSQKPCSYDELNDVFTEQGLQGLDDVILSEMSCPISHSSGVNSQNLNNGGFYRGFSHEREEENLHRSIEDLPAAVEHYRMTAPDGIFTLQSKSAEFSGPSGTSKQTNNHKTATLLTSPPTRIFASALPSPLETLSFSSRESPQSVAESIEHSHLFSHFDNLKATNFNSSCQNMPYAETFANPHAVSTQKQYLEANESTFIPSTGQRSSRDHQEKFDQDFYESIENQEPNKENVPKIRQIQRFELKNDQPKTGKHCTYDMDSRSAFVHDSLPMETIVNESVHVQGRQKAPFSSQESGYHSISPSTNPDFSGLH